MEKKTSSNWMEELKPEMVIIDYDGFDRQNLQYSYYEELVTKEEFFQRLTDCTIVTILEESINA